MSAYLNRVSTAVPGNDVHALFVDFAGSLLAGDRKLPLFRRLAARSQIEHRWSVLAVAEDGGAEDPAGAAMDSEGLYRPGAFASTAARMAVFDKHAPALAERAVAGLDLGGTARTITHVVVTGCTGLSAPGLDLHLVAHLGLKPSTERTVIGFMGCYAAISALKLARHIVRSDATARVLILSLEFCTLHLQETADLEQVLSFLVFGDGAAAALVSAEPSGLRLDSFHAALAPEAAEQITWDIGDQGFDMVLSGQVPASVGAALRTARDDILGGASTDEIDLWAVHPGGRSVLDAVETALALPPQALAESREVLRRFGNMSSATILFVIEALMARARPGERGVAMAFGPGLTAETFRFTAQP